MQSVCPVPVLSRLDWDEQEKFFVYSNFIFVS